MEITEKGLSEKSKYFLLILLLVFIFRNSIFTNIGSVVLGFSGQELSELQVEKSISRIARKYWPYLSVRCTPFSNADRSGTTKEQYEIISKMTDDERFYVIRGGSTFDNTSDYVEIYAIFYCYLFFMEKEYPISINSITWEYNPGGDNSNEYHVRIAEEDFSNLIAYMNIETRSKSSAAKILGDEWIQKKGYVRFVYGHLQARGDG